MLTVTPFYTRETRELTFPLQSLKPKVLLVEEAGQVMEAHVLGSLVESIEHLILIGDPLQLRPTLNNYCTRFFLCSFYAF